MTHDVEPSAPLVSVIIINYNGLRFLDACLESLHSAFERYPCEIVVVDNASTDGSREWLRARHDIVYVESPQNLGFTGGNNLGARHARGQRLLFINNDTVVGTRLDSLIDALDDASVGIVGCRLVYGDGRQQLSFGYDHTPLRIVLSWVGLQRWPWLPRVFRSLESDPAQYRWPHAQVDWVSGACFAVRAEVWRAVGGFDTCFFMYCEDTDLCLRIRQAGFRIVYRPEALVTHFEGAGRPWIGGAALARTARSYLVYVRKHHGMAQACLVSVALGVIFFARALVFALEGLLPGARQAVFIDKAKGFLKAGWLLVSSLGRPSAEPTGR